MAPENSPKVHEKESAKPAEKIISEKQTKDDSKGVSVEENTKPKSVKTPETKETKQPEQKSAPASIEKVSADPDQTATSATMPPSPVSEPAPANDKAPSKDPAPVKIQETDGGDQGDQGTAASAPPPVVRQNSRRVPPGGHTSGGFW